MSEGERIIMAHAGGAWGVCVLAFVLVVIGVFDGAFMKRPSAAKVKRGKVEGVALEWARSNAPLGAER
jgi:hypothetical protein